MPQSKKCCSATTGKLTPGQYTRQLLQQCKQVAVHGIHRYKQSLPLTAFILFIHRFNVCYARALSDQHCAHCSLSLQQDLYLMGMLVHQAD